MSEDRGTLGRQRVLTCQGLMLVVASETELVTKRPAPLRPVSKPLGPPHTPQTVLVSAKLQQGIRTPSLLFGSNNEKTVPSVELEWVPGIPTFPFCYRNNVDRAEWGAVSSCLLTLFLAVTVFQIFSAFDEHDSFEESWAGPAPRVPAGFWKAPSQVPWPSPPRGTLSLETLDGSEFDPAPLLKGEPCPPPCEIILDPEAEHSMDITLVGSSEQSSPPSPRLHRDLIAYEVKVNQRDIEDVCICCGSFQVHTQHPLFEGGMCTPCKDKFLECLFLYDEDGYQSYCSICCAGETLLICENPDCTRCFCFECLDSLVGPGTSGKVQAMSQWVCFLCLPFPRSGLLQRRKKWRGWLKAFCDREAESPLEMYKTVPVWKREPVRVLSLFGDIKKELMSLGFLEYGSEPGKLKHLDDVTNVVRRDVEAWGPFDLTYGSTPTLGHACGQPPAWYLYQFHRILRYARPRPGSPQPFFWMFVDNLVLTKDDRVVATRFLETDPVTIQDVHGSTIQNAVHVWSNIPAVKSRHSALDSRKELSLLAQDRQRAKPPTQGPAMLVKNCFLPLREYFKYFSTELTSSL
ncbi:DNA (cytosine-5)-methyltransferase 3-like [Mesoplodon densirostris]|uniref:DNA (cytosine-5)-methyltransferase 3-like n=1 Tax=Mesoplodon densirostris TaxID=48708 RepID=UPI0028DBC712|nr:DNA (cytosine-5)-methyltransferase 3-like [Mesoplodon densirostris]